MGTRGVIARAVERSPGKLGFEGRYHHWDSYPSGLGQTLFKLANGFFQGDIEKLLHVLIDEHPAGFSTINGADPSLPAGYRDLYGKGTTAKYEDPHGFECFCHGARHEEASDPLTEDDASGCGCEWAYAIDAKTKKMYVLSSVCEDGTKMIGAFGMGDPNASWKIVGEVDLTGKEPDWSAMGGD